MDTAATETDSIKITNCYATTHAKLAAGHWLMCQGGGRESMGYLSSNIGFWWYWLLYGDGGATPLVLSGILPWLAAPPTKGVIRDWSSQRDTNSVMIHYIVWWNQVMWPDGAQLVGCIHTCTYSLVVFIPNTERPSPTARQSWQTGVRRAVLARLLRRRLQMGCTLRSKQNSCCISFGWLLLIVNYCIRPFNHILWSTDWRVTMASKPIVRRTIPAPWGPTTRTNGVLMLCKRVGCRQQWGTSGQGGPDRGGKQQRWWGVAGAST